MLSIHIQMSINYGSNESNMGAISCTNDTGQTRFCVKLLFYYRNIISDAWHLNEPFFMK